MTEGKMGFTDKSHAASHDFASRAMWCQYRFARHVGDAGIMADAEQRARAAGAALAQLLREKGWSEDEVAGYLRGHQQDNPNDYWRRWIA